VWRSVAIAVTGSIAAWCIWRIGRARRHPAPRRLATRLLLSAIDLQRRPPGDTRPQAASIRQALASLRRPDAPRELPYLVVKRTNPRFGTFGHWWVEVDGVESYGWWPHRCPLRVRDFVFGGGGALNGMTGSCAGGSRLRDPHHLDDAEHEFHPVLMLRKSDRKVRADIRAFAAAFEGGWRWSTKPRTDDCRTFQVRLMETVGLVEPCEHWHSRGRGCPFLALFRSRTRELA
jgi:hypothetical protein